MTTFLIICVDPDPETRGALDSDLGRLTGDEFQVESYADGRRAVARTEELAPSDRLVPLMIAADHLPDTTGIDFLMEVHRQSRCTATPGAPRPRPGTTCSSSTVPRS